MRHLVIDLETNMAHDTIWCAVTEDVETGEVITHTNPSKLKSMVETYDYIIGHNIIGFDAPVVRSVWGVSIHRKKVLDTLVMSRLLNPQLEGGHSLKNWGKKLALEGLAEEGKGDFTDYDGGLCDEMIDYCVQDVKLTTILFNYLNKGFDEWKDKGEQALQLEHEVAIEITRQERNGFNLDMPKAQMLLATVIDKMGRIEQELQQVFKPITTILFKPLRLTVCNGPVPPFPSKPRKSINAALPVRSMVVKLLLMAYKYCNPANAEMPSILVMLRPGAANSGSSPGCNNPPPCPVGDPDRFKNVTFWANSAHTVPLRTKSSMAIFPLMSLI